MSIVHIVCQTAGLFLLFVYLLILCQSVSFICLLLLLFVKTAFLFYLFVCFRLSYFTFTYCLSDCRSVSFICLLLLLFVKTACLFFYLSVSGVVILPSLIILLTTGLFLSYVYCSYCLSRLPVYFYLLVCFRFSFFTFTYYSSDYRSVSFICLLFIFPVYFIYL